MNVQNFSESLAHRRSFNVYSAAEIHAGRMAPNIKTSASSAALRPAGKEWAAAFILPSTPVASFTLPHPKLREELLTQAVELGILQS